jgi:hypothetical protein
MTGDLSLDLAAPPKDVLARIATGINRRPKRLLGVLKMENEYIGYVREDSFEIWERRQRAVHAAGTVRGRGDGSHVDVRFFLPLRTRVLTVVFFVLYTAVAVSLALRSSSDTVTIEELAAAAIGAVVLLVIFAVAALRQRSDLRRFVDRLLGDLPRI